MAENNDSLDDVTNFEQDCNHIVFSSDDQRLKMLGEIFGNSTSRSIIALLTENEMTPSQISDRLGIKLNLVMYHLDKMLNLQIISITKKTKSSRGHQMKHYRAKQAVMIFSKDAKGRAEKSKMLSDVIKRITRFSAIGIAGMSTWLFTNIGIQGDRIATSIDSALKYPRPTLPPYMTPIEPQSGDGIIPMVFGIAVVVSLLVMDRMIFPRVSLHRKPEKNI